MRQTSKLVKLHFTIKSVVPKAPRGLAMNTATQ